MVTPSKTNMEPENSSGSSEKPLHYKPPIFGGSTLRIIGPSKAWRHFEDPTPAKNRFFHPKPLEGPSDP